MPQNRFKLDKSVIIRDAEFIKSATEPSQYPSLTLPEIAFAGRSNVGKSSLINTLLNRKRLVKTGSTPGRTQLLNFFKINDAFIFVDLPGYGYAKVPASVRKKWGPMIETYLSKRETIHGVALIMDIRRTPDEKEYNLLNWLQHHHIPRVLILTKTDKLSKRKQNHRHAVVADTLFVNKNEIILFSAKSRQGKTHVWQAIKDLIGPD